MYKEKAIPEEFKTHIDKHSFTVRQGQQILVTWGKGIVWKKKEFSSRLTCIDRTHFVGVVPYQGFDGIVTTCSDVWHTYYFPFKERIKSIVVLPFED